MAQVIVLLAFLIGVLVGREVFPVQTGPSRVPFFCDRCVQGRALLPWENPLPVASNCQATGPGGEAPTE